MVTGGLPHIGRDVLVAGMLTQLRMVLSPMPRGRQVDDCASSAPFRSPRVAADQTHIGPWRFLDFRTLRKALAAIDTVMAPQNR